MSSPQHNNKNFDDANVLRQALMQCKRIFVGVFLFGMGMNALMIFVPMYTMQVLDRVFGSGSMSTLLMLSIITFVALICMSILDVCRNFILMHVGDWLESKVAPVLVRKSIALSLMQGNVSSGEVLRDLSTIKGFLTGHGIFSICDAPWSILYIAIIFLISPLTSVLSVVGIIALITLAFWNEAATKSKIKNATEQQIANMRDIEMATRNSEVMEAMGMSDNLVDVWEKRHAIVRRDQLLTSGRSAVIAGVTKFVRLILQISVIGAGAAFALITGRTPGSIMAASILMSRALAPFESAIFTWKGLVAARMAYKRLESLLLQVKDREVSMSLPKPTGAIEYDKVVFVPSGGSRPTLRGISLTINPGDAVGIVGPSAAGKSTMVKLLMGVWRASSGSVRLDGADVYRWDRREFGKSVGYLPQDIELFKASIRQNIARMNPESDPEMVVAAAKAAGVHEMILSMPQGYETVIGAGGVELSGGQKQRIGLARAFFGDMKLIVLDEPNANLDQLGEMALMNAIKLAKTRGATTVITTHKLSLLTEMSKIIVMREGNVVAYGARDEILPKILPPGQGVPSGGGFTQA